MSYYKLLFRHGPWDGTDLQQEAVPKVMEVLVTKPFHRPMDPESSEVWRYEPGEVVDGVVVMQGKLKPRVLV